MNDLDKLREEQNAKEHRQILDAVEKMVTRSEFIPVKTVVYGMVGIILALALRTMLVANVSAIEYVEQLTMFI